MARGGIGESKRETGESKKWPGGESGNLKGEPGNRKSGQGGIGESIRDVSARQSFVTQTTIPMCLPAEKFCSNKDV